MESVGSLAYHLVDVKVPLSITLDSDFYDSVSRALLFTVRAGGRCSTWRRKQISEIVKSCLQYEQRGDANFRQLERLQVTYLSDEEYWATGYHEPQSQSTDSKTLQVQLLTEQNRHA